ncbi:acyltransferase [Pedobacter yulinensis]|uniref:Acyltransferase n=1 Tax=Pedobacter yulinensis TaxID=2126353 RepID=A0A2T3HQN0_9SPHI|nr:acyltransferase [Pedobacter yulinensis]PST84764.1 acyltransferase [Pedobacter yulinensis]
MKLIRLSYKAFRKIKRILFKTVQSAVTRIKLAGNGVQFGRALVSNGIPNIDIANGGTISIGNQFRMNNGENYNMIGRQQPCFFIVTSTGNIKIGDNVGISGTAFFSSLSIEIGDNVKIGGNTVIYDSDFHSLHFLHRRDRKLDVKYTVSRAVKIEDDVFIGAHTTILKGVTIGNRAIVGAGSVVVKDVPAGEIWAGNPARFIRKVRDVE